MKITCDVIKDILPLYAENMISADTKMIVDEHISSCHDCKKKLSDLNVPVTTIGELNAVPLKKMKNMLFRKKMWTIMITAILSLIVAIILMANLTVPQYYSASDEIVSLHMNDNGLMYVAFDDKVSGYGVSSYISDDGTGYAYNIVAWDSIWSRNIVKSDTQNIVLNPDGEKVSAVYYYETNGSGEVLLYGEQQNPCGVIIKQPKLSLFLSSAAILAVICLILLCIFRKNEPAVRSVITVILLPLSYCFSHLFCKGFSVTGYSTTKDFWNILLLMIPIYAILFAIEYLTVFKKSK